MDVNVGLLSLPADNHQILPTQDSREDSDMSLDIYSSPVEYFPSEVHFHLNLVSTVVIKVSMFALL